MLINVVSWLQCCRCSNYTGASIVAQGSSHCLQCWCLISECWVPDFQSSFLLMFYHSRGRSGWGSLFLASLDCCGQWGHYEEWSSSHLSAFYISKKKNSVYMWNHIYIMYCVTFMNLKNIWCLTCIFSQAFWKTSRKFMSSIMLTVVFAFISDPLCYFHSCCWLPPHTLSESLPASSSTNWTSKCLMTCGWWIWTAIGWGILGPGRGLL